MRDYTSQHSQLCLSERQNRQIDETACETLVEAECFLIKARLKSNGDLALHIIIRINSETSAKFMCATSATSYLHVDQENCLHLVINLRLQVAEYLIGKVNVITFTAKRMGRKRTETSRQSLSELDNTPLHDAVDFQNGKIYKICLVIHIEKSQAMSGN